MTDHQSGIIRSIEWQLESVNTIANSLLYKLTSSEQATLNEAMRNLRSAVLCFASLNAGRT